MNWTLWQTVIVCGLLCTGCAEKPPTNPAAQAMIHPPRTVDTSRMPSLSIVLNEVELEDQALTFQSGEELSGTIRISEEDTQALMEFPIKEVHFRMLPVTAAEKEWDRFMFASGTFFHSVIGKDTFRHTLKLPPGNYEMRTIVLLINPIKEAPEILLVRKNSLQITEP